MKKKIDLVAYLTCFLLVNNVSEGSPSHADSRKDSSLSLSGGNLGTAGKAPLKLTPPSLEENAVHPDFFQRDTELESIPNDDIVEEVFKKLTPRETRENVLAHNKRRVSGHTLKKSSMHASMVIPLKETKIKKPETGRESGMAVAQKDFDEKAIIKNYLQGNKGNVPHADGGLNNRKHNIKKSETTKEHVSPGSVAATVAGLLAGEMVLWRKCENRFFRRNDPELGLATPSMTGFGEEFSDEEIIFERKAAGNNNEPSKPQSYSKSQGTSPPEQSTSNLE